MAFKLKSKKWGVYLVVLIYTLGLFFYLNIINNISFVYDAGDYWERSMLFWKDGFKWENYASSLRGYLLPFILGITRKLGSTIFGNQYVIYRLFYSACCVLLLCILVPELVNVELGTRRWCVGSLITLVIFVYFWTDLLTYPLSDIIGLFFYSLFLVGIKKLILDIRRGEKQILTSRKKFFYVVEVFVYGGGYMRRII